MKKILPILFFSFFLLTLSLVLPKPARASGTLYFSPSSGTKYNGQNFTVAVRAKGMDSINTVDAEITYPADKLVFLSINGNGSVFEVPGPSSGGGGSISINRGHIGNLSGDQLIAYVSFRPKVNTGTAILSFKNSSVLANGSSSVNGTNLLSGSINATFTLADAPPPPPPPVADTSVPTLSAIKVTNLSVNTATITWTTNEASDSYVDYATSKAYFLTAGKGDLVTSHSVVLDSRFLEPGTTYHFMVRSKDSSGNEAKSSDQTFSTVGYEVKVTITDEFGKEIGKTKVTLHSTAQTATTDRNGVATFKNVSVGEHVLTAKVNGQELAATIQVKDSGAKAVQLKDKDGKQTTQFKTETQEFKVKLAGAGKTFNLIQTLSLIFAGILGTVLVVIVIRYLRRRKQTPLRT